MTQLTVTGPYVNKTLFDQAGVALPEGDTTWEEWADVTRQVAEATGTPLRWRWTASGHRLAGPAISEGATYFDDEGYPAVDDEGFSQDGAAHGRLAPGRHHDSRRVDRVGR